MKKVNLEEIKKRKLEECYVIWYFVTQTVPIKVDDIITNNLLYVVYGVNVLGKRKIIGIYFEKPNDNRFWLETLEDLKARNVKKVLFMSTKYNKNLERAVKIVYNDTIIIPSAFDIIAEITKYFTDSYGSDIVKEIKDLFFKDNIKSYKIDFELLEEKYVDNSVVLMLLNRHSASIEKYYVYDKNIRKLLYPHFSIRDMRKNIKKLSNIFGSFNSLDNVVENMLDGISVFEKASSLKKIEWMDIINKLYVMFKESIEVYL